MSTFTPDTTGGRGAWTRKGGLLPGKPGGTGTFGYYRLAALGEIQVGSLWVRGIDKSDAAHAVNAGVKVIQRGVGIPAAQVDGWFGKDTDTAVKAFQAAKGLYVDGVVGPATTKEILRPILAAQSSLVPIQILGGMSVWESALDPAAVGINGYDHGLAQINLQAHAATVTFDQAMDAEFAYAWSAQDMRAVHDRWVGKTAADPWDIAVANHNSPADALAWAKAGAPVFSAQRARDGFIQIDEYVRRVRSSWT
jgi:hypothetical protein